MPRLGLAFALILAPSLALGQPARVENGPLERHAAAGGREGAFRAVLGTLRGAAWLGYEVPAQAGHSSCCYGSTLAIGLHAGRAADTLLVGQARGATSHDLRAQALFWLAQRAGEEAVKAIRAALDDDPEREVKLQALFALSELPSHEGVPLLIDVARTHRDPEVRRQAFVWLGEAEDPRALSFFEQVLLGARAPR